MNIDIIIPTYNSEKTIERALKSISNASKKSSLWTIQILIADGGSKDNTKKIISSYKSDLKIKIVSELDSSPEEGVSKAFNYSKSEYIMFMGSDDYISSSYFLEVDTLTLKDNHILFPRTYIIMNEDNISRKKILYSRQNFLLRYTIPAPGFGWIAKSIKLKEFVLHRKGLLFNNQYKYATDNELLFALIKSGWEYKFMKNHTTSYFFVNGGRSNQNLIEVSNEACEIACNHSNNFNVDIKIIYFLRKQLLKIRRNV